jgi:hypothetical protein
MRKHLRVRPARLLAPIGLAVLSAAVVGQDLDGGTPVEPRMVSQPRPGRYRTALELLAFEAPGAPEKQARAMRDLVAEEMATGNDFCIGSDPAPGAMDRNMLEHIAEGECTFDRFEMNGVAVTAAMSCTRDAGLGSQVLMDGRIWAENSAVNMTLTQDLPGVGATRIRVRARSARVGDC